MLKCCIWGAGTIVFTGPANGVIIPSSQGELGILPGHMALTTTLMTGVIQIFYEKKSVSIDISGGVLLVENDQITVFSSYASIIGTLEEHMVNWIPVLSL